MNRRHLLIGACCVGAIGAAEVLRPRRHVKYLAGKKLDDVIPRTMPNWTSIDATNLVQPREENSLASRIYEQTVGRVYTEAETGFQVMLLAAYGETQSRDLQLHRPETCYPATGFKITQSNESQVPLARGVHLPTRRLIAETVGRRETIIYWSRVGDYFPVGGLQQRLDVLRMAMSGYFADGMLFRVSTLEPTQERAFDGLQRFILAIVTQTRPENRAALMGRPLASTLSANA